MKRGRKIGVGEYSRRGEDGEVKEEEEEGGEHEKDDYETEER